MSQSWGWCVVFIHIYKPTVSPAAEGYSCVFSTFPNMFFVEEDDIQNDVLIS